MKNNQGFTLIEVIIYIALFSLLIGTAFVTAFQLMDGSGKLSTRNTVQEEGNFVLRKINWALTGVSSVPYIVSNVLYVPKYGGKIIRIQHTGKLEISEDNGLSFFSITTDNVSVDSLNFQSIMNPGPGVTATFVINGVTFTTTKYLRK